MSLENPFVDEACLELATFLRDRLNGAYPSQLIVQSIRTYDAFNVPYVDYPLLKVYRLTEDGETNKGTASCQAVISYGLVLPELEHLMPILAWVRKQIHLGLAAFEINCSGHYARVEPRYRAEYRTMFNELTQKVHPFLRFNITLTDNL